MDLELENRSLFVSTLSVLLLLLRFCTVLYLSVFMQGFCITLKLKCTLNSLASLLACLHYALPVEKPLVFFQLNKFPIFYKTLQFVTVFTRRQLWIVL
jgi:hypothetical protein